ncbi:hypothetical protein [Kribbella sp. NBC_00889]|uniref:hypothetical protein n=1 Tax=Kribbella sp. NBC_00889 TaxID=2975974 RepID=UPI00386607EF|nr:hypothetical protein OG817_03885 [Kribbella sp. NBC_00889]
MRKLLRRVATTAAVGAAIAAGGAAIPAEATVQYAPDHFKVCLYFNGLCKMYVEGDIVWGNRTATVTGNVVNQVGNSATATFEGYAGTTYVDTDTRTASGVHTTPYSFVSGDPNLVGGINKIYTTLTYTPDGLHFIDSETWVDIRD